MNDDRIKSEDAEKKLPKPEVYIIRNGDAVFKPGMKTWFVETRQEAQDGSISGEVKGQTGKTITTTVCVCNKVCTCEAVNVCPCQTTCSCQSTCSCLKVGGGTYCSCNKVCTCKPVH